MPVRDIPNELPLELRTKLLGLTKFNRSSVDKEESWIMIQIENNENALVSDRILASKVLWQIDENVIFHVKQMSEKHKSVFLRLEHEMQKERALNHLVDEVKDINPDDLMKALQRMLEKKGI